MIHNIIMFNLWGMQLKKELHFRDHIQPLILITIVNIVIILTSQWFDQFTCSFYLTQPLGCRTF